MTYIYFEVKRRVTRLQKCRQICIFSMPLVFTGIYGIYGIYGKYGGKYGIYGKFNGQLSNSSFAVNAAGTGFVVLFNNSKEVPDWIFLLHHDD